MTSAVPDASINMRLPSGGEGRIFVTSVDPRPSLTGLFVGAASPRQVRFWDSIPTCVLSGTLERFRTSM
jgi:hypothetical protein